MDGPEAVSAAQLTASSTRARRHKASSAAATRRTAATLLSGVGACVRTLVVGLLRKVMASCRDVTFFTFLAVSWPAAMHAS